MLQGFPTTEATALCTFGYCAGPGQEPIVFEGATEGKIVPARGPKNFGWDPIFEVAGTGLTCAWLASRHKEMSQMLIVECVGTPRCRRKGRTHSRIGTKH